MGDSQTGGGAQLVEILLPDVVEALHVFGQGEIGDVEDVAAGHLGVYDAKFQVGFGVGLVVPTKPHMAVPHTLENGGAAFLLVAPLVAPGEMDFSALFMHLVGDPSAKAAIGADDFPPQGQYCPADPGRFHLFFMGGSRTMLCRNGFFRFGEYSGYPNLFKFSAEQAL